MHGPFCGMMQLCMKTVYSLVLFTYLSLEGVFSSSKNRSNRGWTLLVGSLESIGIAVVFYCKAIYVCIELFELPGICLRFAMWGTFSLGTCTLFYPCGCEF